MSLQQGVGIVVFDGAEELDFVGPWEVFTMATRHRSGRRVWLLAESLEPVTCAKGMRVLPDRTLEDAGPLDVLLVPGGRGVRREVENPTLLAWLAERAKSTPWMTSVCTGSALLVRAGVADGKSVTTHWSFVEELRALGGHDVRPDVRYVRDGNVVTAAGVSAGIDMSLWLVGQILGVEAARETQRQMEYDPDPPYRNGI